MPLEITPHAWRRYEERMRAFLPAEQLEAFALAALERGQEVPHPHSKKNAFCRMYRRFSLIFRTGDDGVTRLISILPRGERPHLRSPKSRPRDIQLPQS